jgi:hypothetical protein
MRVSQYRSVFWPLSNDIRLMTCFRFARCQGHPDDKRGSGCVQICDDVRCFRRRSRAACEERTWREDRRSDRQWLQSLHSVGLLRGRQAVGTTHDRHEPGVLPLAVDYFLKCNPAPRQGIQYAVHRQLVTAIQRLDYAREKMCGSSP